MTVSQEMLIIASIYLAIGIDSNKVRIIMGLFFCTLAGLARFLGA